MQAEGSSQHIEPRATTVHKRDVERSPSESALTGPEGWLRSTIPDENGVSGIALGACPGTPHRALARSRVHSRAVADNFITPEGLKDLEAKLAEMEGEARAEIADRILVARGFGDLSENAEYHAAKDDQAHHETAILRLRAKIQDATVIDKVRSDGAIGFGSTVTFLDETSGKEQTFTLVASHEANPTDGKLSAESPMARALMGSSKGDKVSVSLPSGQRPLTVVSVS